MSDTLAKTIAALILIILFLAPFCLFARKQHLLNLFSLKRLVKVINSASCIYLVILILFIIFTLVFYPIIHDPQYMSTGEIIIGGTIIGFIILSICIFLPFMLLLNLIILVRQKISKEASGENISSN